MNQQTEFFFVIEPETKISSGKPYHLEARIQSKQFDMEKARKKYGKSIARREALLEARKLKLMNRGTYIKNVVSAHKKKVKSSVDQKLKAITNNLKAAEEKRMSLLNSQKEKNQEQVIRAKMVAQQQQEKSKLEAEAKKQQILEKNNMAASRRQHLLSIPRSRLLDIHSLSNEELTDIQSGRVESAILIQQWYRQVKNAPIKKLFKNTGLTFAMAKKLSFDKLIRFMKQDVIIRSGARLIQIVKKMSHNPITIKNPSRVFLSAYMIGTHPEDTLPVMGEDEKMVQQAAETMINHLEDWLNCNISSKSFSLAHIFIDSLLSFYTTFDNWKAEDTRKIVDGMIAHWLELEKLWISVRHTQADAETEWKPKICSQQQSILSKLTKIGKSAIEKLNQEQIKLRQELDIADEIVEIDYESDMASTTANESDGNVSSDLLSSSPGRFPIAIKNRRDSVAGSPKRNASPVVNSAASSSLKQEEHPKAVISNPEIISTPVAPQQFGSFLSNEQLAHELVRDPDFELKPNQNKSAMEIRITEIAKKAFFDKVRAEFQNGNYLEYAPGLLKDIKSDLLSMLSETGKMALEINEVLDIELIEQQIKHKAFDGEKCIAYITSKMAQLCAPVRDESIRNIANLYPDLASMFEASLTILEGMKIDLLNYKLKQLRPALEATAVQYEQEKFQQALDSKLITLENTTEWLSTSVKKLEKVAAARNPENIPSIENKVGFEDAYHEGLMNLLFSNKAISRETIPETLLLDAERIFKFQNDIQMVTIVSALIMLAKNAVVELRRDQAAVLALRDRLFVLLKGEAVNMSNLTVEILKAISSSLQTSSGKGALTPENEELIKNMIEKTLSTKDTLYSLISRRIQGCVLGQLKTGFFKSITGTSLASAGLDIIETELKDLSRKIALLAAHNKKVHTKWYDEILKALLV